MVKYYRANMKIKLLLLLFFERRFSVYPNKSKIRRRPEPPILPCPFPPCAWLIPEYNVFVGVLLRYL